MALGDELPDALSDRSAAAARAHDAGDYPGAEAGYRSLIADLTEAVGLDHPLTLVARANLGVVLWRLEALDEAEVVHRDLADALGRARGPGHPAALAARERLGHVLRRLGRLADAEDAYRLVAEERRRALGDHPDTRKAEERLDAVILDRLDDSLQ